MAVCGVIFNEAEELGRVKAEVLNHSNLSLRCFIRWREGCQGWWLP